MLGLIAQGRTNREIAQSLFVSESTVRTHVHSILGKLDLTNRVQAAAYALAAVDSIGVDRRYLPSVGLSPFLARPSTSLA